MYSSGLLQNSGAEEDAPCWPLGAVATHLHFEHSSLYCSFHMLPSLFALASFKLLAFLYLVIVSVCALLDFGIRIRTLLYKKREDFLCAWENLNSIRWQGNPALLLIHHTVSKTPLFISYL